MDLGIFDHLDRQDVPLDEFYESRLRLLERYDAAGFASYHLAEHHATPLGLAPVPGIFLAAATQRTRKIRLGPCVYCLPLYRSEEHTSELQSPFLISYAVFCLKKKKTNNNNQYIYIYYKTYNLSNI